MSCDTCCCRGGGGTYFYAWPIGGYFCFLLKRSIFSLGRFDSDGPAWKPVPLRPPSPDLDSLVRMIIYLKLYSPTRFTTFFGIEYFCWLFKRMYMFFTLCLDTLNFFNVQYINKYVWRATELMGSFLSQTNIPDPFLLNIHVLTLQFFFFFFLCC